MVWPWREPQPPPSDQLGGAILAARWAFGPEQRSPGCSDGGDCIIAGSAPSLALTVSGEAPVRTLSNAPHQPLAEPSPTAQRPSDGAIAAGSAITLGGGGGGGQALVCANMTGFGVDGASAATVEFWMRSTDRCNAGTPFSYATGRYGVGDNTLTITGYNDWQIAIAEDQGSRRLSPTQRLDDHGGFSSATGDWVHIAVTWRADGTTKLYIDGSLAWTTKRAAGMRIPDGGTLVVGREQDCLGGCVRCPWVLRVEILMYPFALV